MKAMRSLQTIIAFLVASAVSSGAAAQLRSVPDEAKRGELRHVQDMIVEIDGMPQRLAPGVQIRDAANRIVVPTAVPPGTPVKYLLNAEGEVRQVWILTPEEAEKR